jgi:hypothetical protein
MAVVVTAGEGVPVMCVVCVTGGSVTVVGGACLVSVTTTVRTDVLGGDFTVTVRAGRARTTVLTVPGSLTVSVCLGKTLVSTTMLLTAFVTVLTIGGRVTVMGGKVTTPTVAVGSREGCVSADA